MSAAVMTPEQRTVLLMRAALKAAVKRMDLAGVVEIDPVMKQARAALLATAEPGEAGIVADARCGCTFDASEPSGVCPKCHHREHGTSGCRAPVADEGLDVERLAHALNVIWPNDRTWSADPPWFREKAALIAAEYARLAATEPGEGEAFPFDPNKEGVPW